MKVGDIYINKTALEKFGEIHYYKVLTIPYSESNPNHVRVEIVEENGISSIFSPVVGILACNLISLKEFLKLPNVFIKKEYEKRRHH